MQYRLAALGGTFDRLHQGHERLLQTAFGVAEKVMIGVTRDELNRSKILANMIESYEIRVANVTGFLNKNGYADRAEIIPLLDMYGPTLTNQEIDALVVSTQTKKGGEEINHLRFAKGLNPLPIVEAVMVKDAAGEHLSSTSIREGITNRQGERYDKIFNQDIVLTSELLARLHQPGYKIWQQEELMLALKENKADICLVGDVVTRWFIDEKLEFKLAIIDGRVGRNQTPATSDQKQELFNPAGTISSRVAKEIIKLSKGAKNTIIKVGGEEDLLAYVPGLTWPLGSLIFYGQPEKGIGMIRLTEVIKQQLAGDLCQK